MTLDRATVKEWIAGGALSDAEALRVVGEDWLRQEEALAATQVDQERQHRRAHDEMRKRQAAEDALKVATDALEKIGAMYSSNGCHVANARWRARGTLLAIRKKPQP